MRALLVGHVAISLIGIATGFVVVRGFLAANRVDRWTALFLATTIATSVTGFPLPADRILPSHLVGVISLVVLGIAVHARYTRRLAGTWRSLYVVTSVMALYLNVFVGVVQAFRHIPVLHALAPTESELPFALTQLATLLVFVALGTACVRNFRREGASAALSRPPAPAA
jgi:hypothetical protein